MSADQTQRLPEPWGSEIDRGRAVSFTFEGRQYTGFCGDTVASALAANGEMLLSRSFKYHRPRGAFTFRGLDANSYIQLGSEPNVHADTLPLTDGLVATGQNYIGSLHRDYGALAGLLSRFMPAGFYYRAFFRPRGIWPWWERLFRRAAGLGHLRRNTESRYFDKQYLFCDVAVIGGGPAGLNAALEAARHGAAVTLIDDATALGGALNYARFQQEPDEIESLRDDLVGKVARNENIRVLNGATCSGWFTDNWLSINASQRLYKLRAKHVIACTGSVEQPMVFRNNDLPGVLPASAVQRLLRLYAVRPGRRAVVVTANAEGYDVVLDMQAAGIAIEAIVDLGSSPANLAHLERQRAEGVSVYQGYAVTEAVAGKGRRNITAVIVNELLPSGEVADNGITLECDLLVSSVGYAPLGQLACHAGGHLEYDDAVNSFVVKMDRHGASIAGSVRHRYALDAVIADGRAAGAKAAREVGLDVDALENAAPGPGYEGVNHPYPVYPHPHGKDFVDFDEDQTVADLRNAVNDGFEHPELAKRYSTAGMGPSQGRLSSLNALRIVQKHNGHAVAGASITTQRPPFKPLSFGVLAGRAFEPERLTPMHNWHADHGALFMPAGLWQRPAHYGGDIDDEVAAIRNNVGVIDVSTLGGIEIRGPDAAEFLNRSYTFTYNDQPVGRSRYLLMVDDSGGVVDDGVACRLAPEYFYVTTTTTGSDAVYRRMLRHNAEWQLQVDLLNVTSTYAAMNVAGPQARSVMQALNSDFDFSKDAFPYLAVRQGRVCEIPVTAFRVGFVGELGYELHVPWSRALELWEAVIAAGKKDAIRPVGVEAQRILRLEKGHLIIGQDTDGLTTPRDAALAWAVKMQKPSFVGRPAIAFAHERGPSRRLVGFRLQDTNGPMPKESHLVVRGSDIVGRVTSVVHSKQLDTIIGLAYVAPDQAEPGSEFSIKCSSGRLLTAQTVATPFYDPENRRQEV